MSRAVLRQSTLSLLSSVKHPDRVSPSTSVGSPWRNQPTHSVIIKKGGENVCRSESRCCSQLPHNEYFARKPRRMNTLQCCHCVSLTKWILYGRPGRGWGTLSKQEKSHGNAVALDNRKSKLRTETDNRLETAASKRRAQPRADAQLCRADRGGRTAWPGELHTIEPSRRGR